MEEEEKLAAAERLISEYGRVLAEHATGTLKPQEALPASKEEIKWALLIMAALGKAVGQISDQTLEHFYTAYASLAEFVPAAEVRGDRRFSEAVRRGQERADWTEEDVKELAKEISDSGFSPERRVQVNVEFKRLIEEFDQILTKLVGKLSEASPEE